MIENTVFRIVQEGLANACRHSKSDRVRVEIAQDDQRLRLEIRDWGIGFDPNEVGEGCFGLERIQERARLFGGEVS